MVSWFAIMHVWQHLAGSVRLLVMFLVSSMAQDRRLGLVWQSPHKPAFMLWTLASPCCLKSSLEQGRAVSPPGLYVSSNRLTAPLLWAWVHYARMPFHVQITSPSWGTEPAPLVPLHMVVCGRYARGYIIWSPYIPNLLMYPLACPGAYSPSEGPGHCLSKVVMSRGNGLSCRWAYHPFSPAVINCRACSVIPPFLATQVCFKQPAGPAWCPSWLSGTARASAVSSWGCGTPTHPLGTSWARCLLRACCLSGGAGPL